MMKIFLDVIFTLPTLAVITTCYADNKSTIISRSNNSIKSNRRSSLINVPITVDGFAGARPVPKLVTRCLKLSLHIFVARDRVPIQAEAPRKWPK